MGWPCTRPTDTSKPPSRAALRKYIGEVLANAADFDAFCLDHFPAVHQRFTNGLDRVSRVNLLLELEQPDLIVRYIRQSFQDRCHRYEHLLQETTPRQKKQQHLSEKLEQKYQEKQRLGQSGMDTTEVDEQILTLRREFRQGPQLVEGELLKGRYKLAQIVGYGGFATVWQAWAQERKVFVAAKVLHSQ